MKCLGNPNNSSKGFTLLEVIVSLIVISLFGAILLGFFQTQIVGSTLPIDAMRQGFALDEIMEKITADYENLVNSSATPLVTLENNINAFRYGIYTPTTKFITFVANSEEATACTLNCTILKVTIAVGNQKITTIFTQ